MTDIIKGPLRQELRVYLTLQDVATMLGVDIDGLSVTHADTAPDKRDVEDVAVRICLVREIPS